MWIIVRSAYCGQRGKLPSIGIGRGTRCGQSGMASCTIPMLYTCNRPRYESVCFMLKSDDVKIQIIQIFLFIIDFLAIVQCFVSSSEEGFFMFQDILLWISSYRRHCPISVTCWGARAPAALSRPESRSMIIVMKIRVLINRIVTDSL